MSEIKDGAFYKLYPDDPTGMAWVLTVSRDGMQINLTNNLHSVAETRETKDERMDRK